MLKKIASYHKRFTPKVHRFNRLQIEYIDETLTLTNRCDVLLALN